MNRLGAHGFKFGTKFATVILKASDQDARTEGSQLQILAIFTRTAVPVNKFEQSNLIAHHPIEKGRNRP
jgi:hypothetical protein